MIDSRSEGATEQLFEVARLAEGRTGVQLSDQSLTELLLFWQLGAELLAAPIGITLGCRREPYDRASGLRTAPRPDLFP